MSVRKSFGRAGRQQDSSIGAAERVKDANAIGTTDSFNVRIRALSLRDNCMMKVDHVFDSLPSHARTGNSFEKGPELRFGEISSRGTVTLRRL